MGLFSYNPTECNYQCIGVPATFAAGATKSSAINLRGFATGAILLPAEFDSDAISFEGAEKEDGTYAVIKTSAAAATGFTAAASGPFWYEIPSALFGCGFIKIVTGTATAAAAEVLVSLRM